MSPELKRVCELQRLNEYQGVTVVWEAYLREWCVQQANTGKERWTSNVSEAHRIARSMSEEYLATIV